MNDGPASFASGDVVPARDLMRVLAAHVESEVTVNLAGTLADVCRATYDPDRDKFVLHLHPDDLDDVLRKLFRRPPP